MKLKPFFYTKLITVLISTMLMCSCGTEEIPPDKLIGEWAIYSTTDSDGNITIWEELRTTLVDLIPEYSCLDFTVTATEQLVTTSYIFVDVNARGCLSPVIVAYTWKINPDTGFYEFALGNNVINYQISYSNSDNRMTWVDQTSGAITVWDRLNPAASETTN